MLEDAAKYSELKTQLETEKKKFMEANANLFATNQRMVMQEE